MIVGRASYGCGDGGKDGRWRKNASMGTLVMVVAGIFGMLGKKDRQCAGSGSRVAMESGCAGRF